MVTAVVLNKVCVCDDVFVRFVYELMMSPGRDECLLGDCGVMVMTMNLSVF